MSSSRTLPIAIVVSGVIIALAVYLSTPHRATVVSDPTLMRPVSAADHIFGNPAAPVIIVEYSDFDCDFCKGFHETLHQLIATEGGEGSVAWVYRHFPLTEIHPTALARARAAECAGAVGDATAFWHFADQLYARQPLEGTSYGEIAASIGLPGEAFATCYADASGTLNARIEADRENALAMGAQGTPFSLIIAKGHAPVVIDGAASYSDLTTLIDQLVRQ